MGMMNMTNDLMKMIHDDDDKHEGYESHDYEAEKNVPIRMAMWAIVDEAKNKNKLRDAKDWDDYNRKMNAVSVSLHPEDVAPRNRDIVASLHFSVADAKMELLERQTKSIKFRLHTRFNQPDVIHEIDQHLKDTRRSYATAAKFTDEPRSEYGQERIRTVENRAHPVEALKRGVSKLLHLGR